MSKQDSDLFEALESIFGPRILGFSPMIRDLQTFVEQPHQKYPPHNIVKSGDNRWFVEVAVAGFDAAELEVELTGRLLTIRGRSNLAEAASNEYIHRGLARRDFDLVFRLGENMEVGDPLAQNGMLTIPVTRVVPESETPRKLKVLDANRDLEDGDPAA